MATAKNLIVTPSWTSTEGGTTGWQPGYGRGTFGPGVRTDAPFGGRLGFQNGGAGSMPLQPPNTLVKVGDRKWEPGKRYYVVASVMMPSGYSGGYSFFLRPSYGDFQGPGSTSQGFDEGGWTHNGEKFSVSSNRGTVGSINYFQVAGYVSVPTDTEEGFWRDSGRNFVTMTGDEDLYLAVTQTQGQQYIGIGYIRVDDDDTEIPWFFDGAGNTHNPAKEARHIDQGSSWDLIEPDPDLEVTYSWDGEPWESQSTATFEMSAEPAQETELSLDITPSSVVVREPITLTATVTPVEASGSVTFTMDGITSSVPVEDGQAVTEVTAFEEGEYEVSAEFIPSGSAFLPSSTTGSVQVDPLPPVVLTEGEYAEVNLWVAGGIDPSIRPAWYHEDIPPGMDVDEEVDSHILYGTPTEVGEFVVTLMGLDLHNFPYEVGTVTITVTEGEPDPAVETSTSVSVVPDEITEGESVSLTATVTPTGAAGSVNFTVNGITSSAQVVNGEAVSEVSIFEWGSYEVLAEFVPTDVADFLPSSGTSSVTVTEYIPPPEPVETTTTLTVVPSSIYEGGSAVLTATVSPAQAQGSITFTLDGATDTIPVSGGTAAREVTVMNAGDYEVNATFAPVSEDHLPSSAAPQILSVQPYVEPVDPEGPWNEWSALASNLAPKVAAYAGRADHAETIETAQAQLPVIVEYIKGHTRGRGFEAEVPASPLLAVIVSACARLVTNPEQVSYYAVGDYSERPALLAGWTLTELDVLRRYRRRYA